jgi:DNA-binding beta-propeller fold protein YncE
MTGTLIALALAAQVPARQQVSDTLMASGQFIAPIGKSLAIPARPVDLALHPNGKWLYAKENRGLTVVDTAAWKVIQELPAQGGASHTGLVVDAAGKRIWFANAASQVHEGSISSEGKVAWTRRIELPKPKIGGEAYPTGIALSTDGSEIFVCASRANQIYRVRLSDAKVVGQIDTDIAPYDLAFGNGKLYVSCWGGKRPAPGTKTAPSSGTPVEVDERGIVKGATLAVHDLAAGKYVSVRTGLQPSDVLVAPDGRAFVANANHDTVSVLAADMSRVQSIVAKPNPLLPFGSAPNALASTNATLFVACGGSNAVAIVSKSDLKILGFFPTGWYPAAIATDGANVYVANTKGTGSRRRQGDGSFGVYNYTGTLQKVLAADLQNLAKHTATVNRLNATATILKSMEEEEEESVQEHEEPRVPVPDRLGEKSSIEHVVYVIKENRTYDQVFGDIKKGDGDPRLCIFGRNVTPNHHALAERFVLLDNYYCNGVNSADGHAWSVEGNASSHLERSFGGWTRSYPFGDDPLSPSSSGFLWDNVLKWRKTFRNYGEFDYAEPAKGRTWKQIYDDWRAGKKEKFSHNIGVERLRRYSHPGYPGWNMSIPDVLRAGIFVKDVDAYNKAGYFPNLTILYLPQDHTSGTTPGEPTSRATVADNDLALGRCVEALTKSKFWKKMAIFVIEDDPQNGFDHIDGHRSICLVISPFSQTGKVVKNFYNQTSVLATMQRILSVPPMNQMDGRAPLMEACFVDEPNFRTYTALANRVKLDELNPSRKTLRGDALKWADVSAKLPRHKPDLMNLEDATQFNRALWYSVYGARPYPLEWSGAHGKGLKKKGLTIVGEGSD